MCRVVGPLVVVRLSTPTDRAAAAQVAARLDVLSLCLVDDRPMDQSDVGDAAPATIAADGVLLDLAAGGVLPDRGIAIVVPRRSLSALSLGRASARRVAPSAAIDAVLHLAADLLTADGDFLPAQAHLAGRALGELVVAALLPLATVRSPVAPQRRASLLEGLIGHVANHLADPLDPATLCAALGCSRSALYRAAVPVGGVAALVAEQRLAAVHDRLGRPDEGRTIATLARAHGFADPAAFSRIFKRRFGVTPLAVRRRAAAQARRR